MIYRDFAEERVVNNPLRSEDGRGSSPLFGQTV